MDSYALYRGTAERTNEGNVFIFDFEKGEKKEILFNAYNARYTQSGHIVFVRGSLSGPFL